jgi:hypothetical protein
MRVYLLQMSFMLAEHLCRGGASWEDPAVKAAAEQVENGA